MGEDCFGSHGRAEQKVLNETHFTHDINDNNVAEFLQKLLDL